MICVSDGCQSNDDLRCFDWANDGDCITNADWMLRHCAAACDVSCNAMGTGRCSNLDYRCNTWADTGECGANSDWMLANCPWSCDASCQGHDAEVGALRTSGGDCVNLGNDLQCDILAARWGCVDNTTMLENCRKSCFACVTTGKYKFKHFYLTHGA